MTTKNDNVDIEIRVDESMKVEVTRDKMLGVISFTEPENGGSKLTLDEIKKKIKNAGIVHGINEELLESIDKERKYDYKYLIASGTPAVHGEDGRLEFFFDTKGCSCSSLKPKENEDGSVDFKKLDIIKTVKKDELLVKAHPPIEGTPGMTVLGKEIKPAKGKKVKLPKGKNIYTSSDGMAIHSSIEGQIMYNFGTINITETYVVEENAGVATGNIDFPGNILVRGSVESGFEIKAGGNVEVQGYVEEATIIAGGNIVLRHGIQGKDNGKLVAGGDIITKFIQNSIVEANGCLYTEAIMHSKVEVGDSVIVEVNKGLIVGGSVQATKLISAKTIGSPMSTATKVQLSMPLSSQHKYNETQLELNTRRQQLDQVEKNIAFIQGKIFTGEKIPKKRLDQVRQLLELQNQLKSQIKKLQAEFDSLSKMLTNYQTGKIKVREVIYPGSKVVMGKYIKHIKEDIKYATIYIENKDIKVDTYS